MPDLDLIDCHVHAFPSYQEGHDFMVTYLNWAPERIGTLQELLSARAKAGHARTNILMYTPTTFYYEQGIAAIPDGAKDRKAAEERVLQDVLQRQRRNNDWGSTVVREHPGLSYFCGVDCTRMSEDEMLGEVERNLSAGASGVKIVFTGLKIYGDDPRLGPLYDYCASREVPILAQSSGRAGPCWGRPAPFGKAVREFPDLRLIFAHLCHFPSLPGEGIDELAEVTARFPNVCADLSLRLTAVARREMSPDDMAAIIRRLGPEHVLFGTNFPLADPVEATRAFQDLPLTEAEHRAIGHDNFVRLTT